MRGAMPNRAEILHGFTPLSDTLGGVLKEIQRRSELRPRLDAEMGRSLNNDEFLAIAERSGVRI
jgi:hypothetical protein